MQKKNPFNQKN